MTTPAGGSATAVWSPPPDPQGWRGLRPGLRERLTAPMPQDKLIGWGWPLLVTLLAAYLRFNSLGKPRGLVFDEVYYAHDASSLLENGVERGPQFKDPAFIVHPPLGKWMIAVGEWLFGNGHTTIDDVIYPSSRFGWRFSAALIGSLSVLILIRTVRRMTRSTLLGCIAGLLLTFDGLAFVESRISMLDIFLMFWVLAGFACLVIDRDHGRRRLADRLEMAGTPFVEGPALGFRPWRLAAALCLGAAVATKWSGIFYVLAFLVMAFLWDVGARRTGGSPKPIRTALRYDAAPLFAFFFALGFAVYVVSWSGWFITDTGYDRHWAADPAHHSHWHLWKIPLPVIGDAMPETIRNWVHYHHEMWHFHATLDPSHSDSAHHPYQSHSWGWLALARPVSYFYASPKFGESGCDAAGGCSQEILGIGTPAIWWATIPAIFALLWFWISKRDWRAGAALLGIAAAILPWIPSDLHQRTMFLFYALPAVPFMAIGLTLCIGYAIGPADASPLRRQIGTALAGAYLLLVIANFFWLHPVLAADVMPYSDWKLRMWFPSWI